MHSVLSYALVQQGETKAQQKKDRGAWGKARLQGRHEKARCDIGGLGMSCVSDWKRRGTLWRRLFEGFRVYSS